VEALILSHGHFDHFYALDKILGRLSKGILVVLHPEAFLNRRLNIAPWDAGPFALPGGGCPAKGGVKVHMVARTQPWDQPSLVLGN